MRKYWAIGLSVLVLIAIAAAFWRVSYIASRSGEDAPLYSTERYDPYGTAAFREFLQKSGHPVRVLTKPRLEKEDRGVFIQVINLPEQMIEKFIDESRSPDKPAEDYPERAYSPDSLIDMTTEDLADWIAQGNTVIQMTRTYTDLMEHLNVPTVPQTVLFAEEVEDQLTFEKLAASIEVQQRRGVWPVTASVIAWQWMPAGKALGGRDNMPVQLMHPRVFQDLPLGGDKSAAGSDGIDGWQPLVKLDFRDRRKIAIGQMTHGKGKLVVVGCPTPVLNEYIDEPGNLQLLLGLIGDQPVILDDWQHGVGRVDGVIDLIRKYGLYPVLLQLLLLVLIYNLSTRGLARIDPPQPARKRSSIEQIHTLGSLYHRSLDTAETFRRAEIEVRRRIAVLLRCSPDQVEAHLKHAPKPLAATVSAMLGTLNQIRGRVRHQTQRGIERELADLLTLSGRLLEEHRP